MKKSGQRTGQVRRALRVAAAILATAHISLAPLHAAQPEGSDPATVTLAKKIRTAWSDDAFLDRAVRTKYPRMSDDQYKLLREHLQDILMREPVFDKILVAMKSAFVAKFDQEQMHNYMAEVGVDLQVKGIARLSDEDLELVVSMSRDMMAWMPAKYCKQAALDQLSNRQLQAIEASWMATLALPDFKKILAMYKRAMLAEASDSPRRRTLNKAQRELAQKAIGEAIDRRFKATGDADGAYEVIDSPQDHEPTRVCAVMKEVLTAHLDIKGPVGKWALINFAEEMAAEK